MTLFRQLAWSLAGSFGAGVLAFATQLGASYALSASEYGQYSLIIAALTIATVASLWTSVSAVRFGSDEYREHGTLARTFSARLWITSPAIGAAIVLLVIAPRWLCEFFELPPGTTRLVAAPLAAFAIHEHVGAMALAMLRFRLHAVSLVVSRVPPLAVIVAALVRGEPASLAHLTIALAVGYLVASIIPVAGVGIQPIHPPARADVRRLFAYSTPLFVTAAANTAVGAAGPVLLRYETGLAAIGTFQLASLVGNVFSLAATSVNRVALPRIVRLDDRRARELVETSGTAVTVQSAAAFGGVAIVAGAAFAVVGASGYGQLQHVVPAIVCMGAYRLASCLPGSYGNARDLTRPMAVANVIAAGVNVLLALVLAREIGAAGPAVALALSEWLNTVLYIAAAGVPTASVVRTALLALVPSLYPLAFAGGWCSATTPRVAGWAAFCLAYALVIRAMRRTRAAIAPA
jgi:O-antigen/teichoic acid export membrane protein